MILHNSNSDIFIPDNLEQVAALQRTSHLSIAAHQDDVEILAFHGILQCYADTDNWFSAVVCADGAGSPRSGIYANYSDKEMQRTRLVEQRTAATIGKYSAMLQLGYPSQAIKNPADDRLEDELFAILQACRPKVVYTHNPADKHATHIGVLLATLKAIRKLPFAERPQTVYGCEVWRGLDWLPDHRKVILDVSGQDKLATELLGGYQSQIAGGKRYDLAELARRRANATFLDTHATDNFDSVSYAIDLTPLCHNDSLDVVEFISTVIDEYRTLVCQQLNLLLGR